MTVRLSTVARCARQACYQTADAPGRERTEWEHRIFFRGNRIGRDYADWLEARDGPGSVEREVKIPWEHGVGHLDIFHVPTETAIEVLSSAHAATQLEPKLRQLVLYMEHYERAVQGMVVVVNPSDFSEERHPVARGTDRYLALVAEGSARIKAVQDWAHDGTLPARVCASPTDGQGHMCVHREHCFDGWTPAELPVDSRPATLTLASQWRKAKAAEREAGATLKEREAERKAVEAELAVNVPTSEVCGGFVIRRTDVRGQVKVSLDDLKLAGVDVPDDLIRIGAGHTRWDVSVADGAADVDFGEVPF